MEVTATVNLNGLEEMLQQIGPKLARKTLRKAVGAAGAVWVAEAKMRAPADTGDLKDSIGKKVTTKRIGDAGEARVAVGPMYGLTPRNNGDGSQQPSVYGMFVEFGTKRSRPQPFLRPTFDSKGNEALETFIDTLRNDLEELVRG